jgi:hypothetical protein
MVVNFGFYERFTNHSTLSSLAVGVVPLGFSDWHPPQWWDSDQT